jgi:hypothetical protein
MIRDAVLAVPSTPRAVRGAVLRAAPTCEEGATDCDESGSASSAVSVRNCTIRRGKSMLLVCAVVVGVVWATGAMGQEDR